MCLSFVWRLQGFCRVRSSLCPALIDRLLLLLWLPPPPRTLLLPFTCLCSTRRWEDASCGRWRKRLTPTIRLLPFSRPLLPLSSFAGRPSPSAPPKPTRTLARSLSRHLLSSELVSRTSCLPRSTMRYPLLPLLAAAPSSGLALRRSRYHHAHLARSDPPPAALVVVGDSVNSQLVPSNPVMSSVYLLSASDSPDSKTSVRIPPNVRVSSSRSLSLLSLS